MKPILLQRLAVVAMLLIVSLKFTSCQKENSSDVNQDKVYAEYELFYDQNANVTYASAIFKFSNAFGTNLKLSGPSSIKFGTDTIPYDPVFAYYRKEYAGLINSGTFTYTDSLGHVYTNSVTIAPAIACGVTDTIHKSSAFTYSWVGASIASNEFVGLTISNTANAFYYKYFAQYTVGSTNLILSTTDLNYLPNGASTVSLVRQVETAAPSVTSAGGKIRGKYKSANGATFIAN